MGDGVTDDGPALQSALEALNTQGGGTLIIPPGKYAIISEVFNNFGNPSVSRSIVVRGAGTASQLLVRSGAGSVMWTLQNVEAVIDNLSFVGAEGNPSDAKNTVYVLAGSVNFRNSRFIGIATGQYGDGAVVRGHQSALTFDHVNFGGCTGHSGVGAAVVTATQWNVFNMNDVSFVDYGTVDGFGLSKTSQAGYAWIYLKEPEVASANNRAFADLRNVVMDEGAQFGMRIESFTGRISAVKIENLRVNGSFLGAAAGVYIHNTEKVKIERARFGHNQTTSSPAVKLVAVGDATIEHLLANESLTNRIDADSDTRSLTIIDSEYGELNSQAKVTRVVKGGKFDGLRTMGQIISEVAEGTAPFSVESSTQVPKLNASLVGGKAATEFALADHLHDGLYAPLDHVHDALYAALNHDHNDLYEPKGQLHDDRYARVEHNHDAAYSAINHNHDAAYATKTHNHDGVYLKQGDGLGIVVTSAISTINVTAPSQVVFGDASAARLAVVLPQVGNGPYTIKKTDSSANIVQVNPSGNTTIEGKAILKLPKQDDYVILARDKNVWRIIVGNVVP
jgi:hypothetical protein